MIDILNNLNFLRLIWIFPIMIMIHELEEWNILRWYEENYDDLPPITNKSVRLILISVIILCYLWTGLAYVWGNPRIAAYIMLPLMALFSLNILQHIYWHFAYNTYAPGVYSAMQLLLAAIVVLAVKINIENYVSGWYPLVLGVLVVAGLIQTVRAKNQVTPIFEKIHLLSIRLVKALRLE